MKAVIDPPGDIVPWTEKQKSFVPFGEAEAIELSVGMVKRFLAIPTKSGKPPTDADCLKFVMLCQSRQLNPWVKDCWLVGYDSKDGPTFELITSHQALLKRAEANPAYRGMRSGVIVRRGEEVIDLDGAFSIDGDVLLGGWASVIREDRDVEQVGRVKLATYNTGMSRWAKDPHGMIAKVAEAAALRKAFPTQLGEMYCAEEMGEVGQFDAPVRQRASRARRSRVADRFMQPQIVDAEPVIVNAEPSVEVQPPVVEPEAMQPDTGPSVEDLIASGELVRDEPRGGKLFDDEEPESYYGEGG